MMRKILLLAAGFCMLIFMNSASAQVVNQGFEIWATDTTRFAGIQPYLPAENFSYNDPVDWTTSNSITGMTALGGHLFVTQSTDAHEGSSAVRIITDTIARVFTNQLTVPGFAINGYFTVELTSLIGGLNITPMSVAGAGQPFNQRLTKLKGYYKYAPQFNPNTNTNDTCLIWATLRKGKTAVADAIFKSTLSTGGVYQHFDITFNYHNCEQPDTLVILLSSSIPKTAGLLSGQSDLVRGSELLVDSIYYDVIGSGYNFTPIARDDRNTTDKNTQKTFNVLANDEDCDNPTLSVSILLNASNGTATVQSNQIVYIPATDFIGRDSVYYQASDGTNNDAAWLRIVVKAPTGISEANRIPVAIYPNPAQSMVHIRLEPSPGMYAVITDQLGKQLSLDYINSTVSNLSVSRLAAGMYFVQIFNADKQLMASERLMVHP